MTLITKNNVSYIRNHMKTPDEELSDKFGLSEYVVSTIKEAKRNNYWKEGRKGFFHKLTPDMKEYLLTVDYKTQRDLKNKFNRTFGLSDLTPLSVQSIIKYKEKLEG